MKKINMKRFSAKIIFLGLIFFVTPIFVKAAVLGSEESFYVDSSYDASGRAVLNATLVQESEHAYFYAESDWWDGLTNQNLDKIAVNNLAMEFDKNIYPKATKVFGPPWEPGIDNDPKITILISRLKDTAGGYLNTADEYPKNLAPYSNEREMIYLNTLYYNTTRAKSFLAHEFQHLITFYSKEKKYNLNEEVWLNEARSEFTPTLIGYDAQILGSNLDKRIADFLRNPSDSLTEWTNMTADYGVVNLFMQYLVEHYGEQILTKMVESQSIGIASINDALKSLNINETFSMIFSNWLVANYLNDCNISQKYCYLDANLAKVIVTPSLSQALPTLSTSTVTLIDMTKDWSGHWYEFVGKDSSFNNLRIDFKGENSFAVIYIAKNLDGSVAINFINLDPNNKGAALVKDFGKKVKSVTLIPISEAKTSGFGASEPLRQFSFKVSLTNENIILSDINSVTTNLNYPDGSLIRAKDDYKVYLINGGYKRWIQNPTIFGMYEHFKWQNVIEVSTEQLEAYQESSLLRAENDKKVYEVNGDASKHWLNMTAEQFSQSGRQWGSVFIINSAERNFYKTGADVMFR